MTEERFEEIMRGGRGEVHRLRDLQAEIERLQEENQQLKETVVYLNLKARQLREALEEKTKA